MVVKPAVAREVAVKGSRGETYHRRYRMDWTAAQRARRDAFHDDSWAGNFTQSRIPESAVHLIIGDSLIRVLTRIQAHWQVGILSFSDWPGLRKACEKWVNACLSCLPVKDPRKMKFALKSVENWSLTRSRR